MKDPAWCSISKGFKNGLIELLSLKLLKEKPDTPSNLLSRIEEIMGAKTGLLYEYYPRNIEAMLRSLGGNVQFENGVWVITDSGKEEIEDRLAKMQDFIGYMGAK